MTRWYHAMQSACETERKEEFASLDKNNSFAVIAGPDSGDYERRGKPPIGGCPGWRGGKQRVFAGRGRSLPTQFSENVRQKLRAKRSVHVFSKAKRQEHVKNITSLALTGSYPQ